MIEPRSAPRSRNSTPSPGGPSLLSRPRRHATTPLSATGPAPGTASFSSTSPPIGTSCSVSRNSPPRDTLTEYATRNDDAVRNSTSTAYGTRWCSRSDIECVEYRLDPSLQQPLEQPIEMIEVEVADRDGPGLAI